MNDSAITVLKWSPTQLDMATDPSEHPAFKVTKILVYLFIFVLSMLGNCTVIAIICRSRIMKSVAGNLLILNLALCDFLTPFLSIPFDMAVEENNGQWPYGQVMCKFLWPAATWTATSSSLTLAAIAFERYRGLMHPFKSRLTITHVKRTVVSIHAFSLLAVIPYALVLHLTEGDQCVEQHWPDPSILSWRQVYTMSLFIVQYVAPLFFMTYMYSQTSKSLFISTERVRTSSTSSIESNGSFSSTANRAEPPLSRSIFKNIQQEQNVKITKMFIVVVIIFAICMLPNQVMWLWSDFGGGQENSAFTAASIVCRFFSYANSCLNPLIFFKFSREFRRGLRRLYLKAGCCVTGRRKVILAYRSWRSSSKGPLKSGRTSSTRSQESHTSTSSAFEKEERKVTRITRLQRKVTLAQGFWTPKMDNMWVNSCPFLGGPPEEKPKEVITNYSRECGQEPNTAKMQKLSLTKEAVSSTEINVEDLLKLPHLTETCC